MRAGAGGPGWRAAAAGVAGVVWLLPVLQWAALAGGLGGVALALTRPVSALVLLVLLAGRVGRQVTDGLRVTRGG